MREVVAPSLMFTKLLQIPATQLDCGNGHCCRLQKETVVPACCFSEVAVHLGIAFTYIFPEYLDSYVQGSFERHMNRADNLIRKVLYGQSEHGNIRWLDVILSPHQWPICYLLKEVQHSPIQLVNLQNQIYYSGLEPRVPLANSNRSVILLIE